MINLIGLAGYAASGKSTVGKIIQYLHSRYKDGYDKWCEMYNQGFYQYQWQIKGFSVKLKEIASLLTGIPAYKFEEQEFKKQPLDRNWTYPIELYGQEQWVEMTGREFLQRLGTDAIRDQLHPNTWVNALFADYTPKVSYQGYIVDFSDNNEPPEPIGETTDAEYPKWIITDVRFPNEAQAIKNKGGIIVRIDRYQKVHKSIGLHLSETSLDDWEFDYRMSNDGTIEELIEDVREMLLTYEII